MLCPRLHGYKSKTMNLTYILKFQLQDFFQNSVELFLLIFPSLLSFCFSSWRNSIKFFKFCLLRRPFLAVPNSQRWISEYLSSLCELIMGLKLLKAAAQECFVLPLPPLKLSFPAKLAVEWEELVQNDKGQKL